MNRENEFRRILGEDFISIRSEQYMIENEEIERVFLRVREVNFDQLISISREFYDHPGRIEIVEQTRIQIFPTKEDQTVEIVINDFS